LLVKDRFIVFARHRAETMHATHVVNAVHHLLLYAKASRPIIHGHAERWKP
jgi:hypothetical protein